MDAHEFYRYSSVCFKNNITIYPIPLKISGTYKIAVNRNGREKVGKEIYRDKPFTKIEEVVTSKGIKKIPKVIPSLVVRMFELYRDIAIKNKFLTE